VRRIFLSIVGALSLIGDLLTIIGVFLRWGRLSNISGWDIITTNMSGNLNVFLLLIGGIVVLFGGLALISAFIGNWALAVKRRIAYLSVLGILMAIAGWGWSVQKYGFPLSPGLWTSLLGVVLLAFGAAGFSTASELFVKRKKGSGYQV
jgi:hypothetical protein